MEQGNNKIAKHGFHVIFVYADGPTEWNCSQWRSLTPSDAINRSENNKAKLIHVSGFVNYLSPAIQDLIMPADLIVFQRNLTNEKIFEAIQYWQGLGKPVVVDLDDAYHILPWSNPAHRYWHEKGDKEIKMLERGLQLSNGLIAPNRLLLADWEYATPGYYLQNFAEEDWWIDLPSRKSLKKELDLTDKIVIGWGGSVSHYDSWHGSGIMDAAKTISENHPEVIWMICGNDPRIHDHLDVPTNQKYQQKGVPPNKWAKVVRRFDIGIAPLFGPYDQRRSWIKGLEYLLAGVPWIGTRGEPYKELGHLGTLIPNGCKNWESAIETKITNLQEEQEVAQSRIELAQQWFANNQMDTYTRVFQRIVNEVQEKRSVLPEVYYVTQSGNGKQKKLKGEQVKHEKRPAVLKKS